MIYYIHPARFRRCLWNIILHVLFMYVDKLIYEGGQVNENNSLELVKLYSQRKYFIS